MSGSTGANLPVRIEVQGTQQAEAQFNQVGQAGAAAMGRVERATSDAGASTARFGQIVGQAGFQIGDFASQVQAGGSALTALSQQGSQFLGAFGVGGAVAGAALTVGILAAQLLTGRDNAQDLAKVAEEGFRNTGRGGEDLARTIERVNELYLTQAERAQRAGEATRAELVQLLRLQQSNAIQMQEGSAMELPGARRDLEREERRLATIRTRNERLRRAGSMVPTDEGDEALGRVFTARARIQGLEADLGRQSSRIGQINEAIRRAELSGVDLGHGQFGPPAPGAARAERVAMGVEDVQGALLARTEELTRQFDAYNQALNLSTAGLERAAPALQAYAREQELLTTLLNNQIISEEEFTAEVERSSIALQDQIRAAEERADRASGAANQLGFSFSSAFEDAIVEGKALSDVLKGLEQDIARIIIRSAVTQPLGNAISGVVSAGVSGLFGGGTGTPAPTGARAAGGPVFPGGTYLVGERGPELLTMGAAGHVTPNAGGPSISQTFNIDARGADASMVPRLRAEMVAVARAANAELLAEIQRGGRAASIVGRR
jgi:hypothetical protein